MKKINYTWLILLIVIITTAASCSSERRASGKNCGCGVHKGYVGY
jgi:hypothetical protein